MQGTLPMGQDTVLGLEDDYSARLYFTSLVPGEIESAVVHRCSQLRATRHRDI